MSEPSAEHRLVASLDLARISRNLGGHTEIVRAERRAILRGVSSESERSVRDA